MMTSVPFREIAKVVVFAWQPTLDSRDPHVSDLINDVEHALATANARGRAAGLEAAALVADTRAIVYAGGSRLEVGKEIAAAIRALGKPLGVDGDDPVRAERRRIIALAREYGTESTCALADQLAAE
ncbi:MAG TPA: hypothetical protein VLA89_05635 [Gemmatimonadales bacterium]|nr:hypothetical protein [Gemmatimonadales bacterium]